MTAEIKTDIIIPVYRPGERFIRLLDMLSRQTRMPHGLVIINTEESLFPKEAEAALERFIRKSGDKMPGGLILRHIKKKDFDHAGTRNLGIRLSNAETFICMTDDAVPADECLIERLQAALMQKGPGGETIAEAYARQLPMPESSETESFTRSFNYPESSFIKTAADRERLGIKTYFASNVCCIYRRDIFDRLGGFSEPAVFNEDMVYAASAINSGYGIAYAADARVYHSHSYGAAEQLRRNFDLGMSQKLHAEIFSSLKSEGEGIRLVLASMKHLASAGKVPEIPGLIVDSGAKYLGYLLGKNYGKLSEKTVRRLSSNQAFLDKLYRSGHIS